MSADPKAIGRRVRALRELRGLTAEGLSAGCGLSKSFISEVENGHSALSITSAAALAKALDTRIAVLVGEEPMPVCPTCRRPHEAA